MNVLTKDRLVETSAVATLIFSQSFNGLVAIALVSDLPVIATHFAAQGNSVFFAQMVMVAPAISIILGSPLASKLARFAGPRRLMICALLIYVLAGCFGALSPGRVPLLVSRVLLGLASSFLTTISISLASGFGETRRNELLGYSSAVAGATVVAGIMVAGWLTSRHGWTAPFILYLWPLPLLPALILSTPDRAPASDILLKDGFFDALRAGLPVYLLTIVLCLLVFAPSLEGPFVLAARGVTNPSFIGSIISLNVIVTIASATTYGWLSRKIPPDGVVQVVFALFLISTAIITFSRQALGAEIGLVAGGLAAGPLTPMLIARLLQYVQTHQAATALGWFLSALYASQIVDPILFSLIKKFLPFPVYGALSIVCCIGLAAFMFQGLPARFRSGPKPF